MIDTVHDSVRAKNDLANAIVPIFGHDATQLWKIHVGGPSPRSIHIRRTLRGWDCRVRRRRLYREGRLAQRETRLVCKS